MKTGAIALPASPARVADFLGSLIYLPVLWSLLVVERVF